MSGAGTDPVDRQIEESWGRRLVKYVDGSTVTDGTWYCTAQSLLVHLEDLAWVTIQCTVVNITLKLKMGREGVCTTKRKNTSGKSGDI